MMLVSSYVVFRFCGEGKIRGRVSTLLVVYLVLQAFTGFVKRLPSGRPYAR